MAKPNYFTCTLGQASALNLTDHDFKNINTFIDSQATSVGNNYAVGFAVPPPSEEEGEPWSHIAYTFNDLRRISVNLALEYQQRLGSSLKHSETIALICPSTPDFLFTWLALMRLGLGVLLIAPQCQPAAIAHLCKACKVTTLVFDVQYRTKAEESAAEGKDLEITPTPFKKDSFLHDISKRDLPNKFDFSKTTAHDVAYLHHTSGTSSGLPKPIPQTHRAGCGVLPHFPDGSMKATFTTTPLYHGGIADAFRAWTSGSLIWLFPGKGAPITARNIIRCLEVADKLSEQGKTPPVKYFSSVPYVLQSMEADDRGLERLKQMDIVGVGGAALPAEVGDRLVQSGVNLISRFGSAECGFLMSSHRDYAKDREWQYLRSGQGSKELLRFENQEDNLVELIIGKDWPHMAKRNREDGSFATADLFAPHESIPDAWRYHSRADSQLTLITGKKFDPAPLEAAIATSPSLEDVLIFGNGQPYAGALLFRSEQAGDVPDRELVEQLWPMIERLNAESQDHARLLKQMLVAMPRLQPPLEKSSKGTIMRGVAEKRFAADIEKAYTAAGDGDLDAVPDDEVLAALRKHIKSVVGASDEPEDDTDLYAYGVDSVAGMRIRNSLQRMLPQSAKKLPLNIVEDCGSAKRLASLVVRLRHGQDIEAENEDDEKKLMLDLVKKYSNFKAFTNGHVQHMQAEHGTEAADLETVVLTGATGALGAHLLYLCSRDERVKKVYCLVRGADDHACEQRVSKALEERGLGPLDASSVVVLRSSLSDRRLGLSTADYDRLASEASIIVHAAWSVNFRMRLRSFEKDNIAGLTNLIGLALGSTRSLSPRFGFCSSVASVICSGDASPVPETISQDPGSASALGYSRSKWVAERICDVANTETKLAGRITVFRVGQLAGDSHRGIWNTKEAWPLMLSAVKITGTLPDLADEKLDWLPVDVAAAALMQKMAPRRCGDQVETPDPHPRPKQATDVMHVVHVGPNPKWHQLLLWLQQELDFAIVGPKEWVGSLEGAAVERKTADHPSLKLLELWKAAYGSGAAQDNDNKAGGSDVDDEGELQTCQHGSSSRDDVEIELRGTTFAMDKTKQAMPVLTQVEPVGRLYVVKLWRWIDENM